MQLDVKYKVFEHITVLNNLAHKEPEVLPDDLCIFLTKEFNLIYSAVFVEIEKNKFELLGNSVQYSENKNPELLSVINYDELYEKSTYEKNFWDDCNIGFNIKNLQSIILWNEKKKFLLLLKHKNEISEELSNNFKNVLIFVNYLLKTSYKNFSETNVFGKNISEILKGNTLGFSKDLTTINGLLTLIKEENISGEVNNYLEEIKIITNSLLKSTNDLSKLFDMEKYTLTLNEAEINFSESLSELKKKIKSFDPSRIIGVKNNISLNFHFDKDILEYLLFTSACLSYTLSKTKIVKLNSSISSENYLRLNFSADTIYLSKEILEKINLPFNIKEIDNSQSGLVITLLEKYLEILNGKLNIYEEENRLNINLSFPVKTTPRIYKTETEEVKNDNAKILIINKEQSNLELLKRNLNKWNYETEFILNNHDFAIEKIKSGNYAAVILNIEHNDSKGLALLTKIKSNNQIRNIPVIVFTLDTETESFYIMGSVDYLVKPINYNNLVEIISSYRMKRSATVLCVDDDIPTLNLVKQAVQTAGFETIAESKPELVIEQVKDKHIDLAIIDLDMPKISGIDLIYKLKSDNKYNKLPIIIYTGKDDYQDELQQIDGMFDNLLEKKSTSINELEKTISEMIDSFEDKIKEPEETKNSNGPVILMAEDYKHSQIIVSRILKKNGYENIILVENGAEALEICKNQKIDLVLMDMQMPVMNGFEATGKIRELDGYEDTPIISLTAFAMKGDREKCLEAGATDYIPKPIDSKEFLEKVKYYTQLKIPS